MSTANRNNRRGFCVVQFIEKPFVGVDDCECVPRSWVLPIQDKWVTVAYPEDEDPFDTRERVKKEEKCGDRWMFYVAIVRYESDTYRDAEFWKASRNDYALVEEGSDIRETQPEPVLDKKVRSATRDSTSNSMTNNPQLTEKPLENSRTPILKKTLKRVNSEPKEDHKKKVPKLDEAAKSTNTIVNYANPTPGCSKTEESIIFWDEPLIQSDKTEITAAASSGRKTNTKQSTKPKSTKDNKSVAKLDSKEQRHSTSFKQASKQDEKQPAPVLQVSEQDRSMPLLDVDEPTVIIDSDEEIQPLHPFTVHRPSSSQIPLHASQLPCQPEYVQDRQTSVALRPDNLIPVQRTQEMSDRQSKETNRHDQKPHLHVNTAARTTAPATTNQFSQPYQDTRLPKDSRYSYLNSQPREVRAITNNMPSTSLHIPNSVKTHLEHIKRKIATAAQNSSSSTDNSSSILTLSMKRQTSLVIQRQSQDGLRVQETHARNHIEGNGNDQSSFLRSNANCSQKVPRKPEMHVRGSNEVNGIDHNTNQDNNIANNTSAAQILSNFAHQSGGIGQQSNARQDLLTQEYYLQKRIQALARLQDLHIKHNGVQIIDHSVRFQDMANEAFAAQNRSNPANQLGEFHTRSHEQQKQLSQELIRRSTENNKTEHRPPSRNNRVPSAEQNSSNVSNQLPPYHEYSQRDPRLTRTRADISMKTNSISQRPGLQGVTKQTLPPGLPKASNLKGQAPLTANKHDTLEVTRTQASLSRRSDEQNNIDVAAVPRNITAEPSLFMHNGTVPPTYSGHQSHEIQHTPVHQNHVYQDPRTQKLLVNQSTETNFTMKPDIIRSSAMASSPRVVDSACQTDEIEEHLSTYQEVVSDYEVPTTETLVGIVNDVNRTVESVSPESDPANRPINELTTLLKQMGRTLNYTCYMFMNSKSAILESVKTYKSLLETFDALRKLEASPETEERGSGEVERERSGSGAEDFNNRVNGAPNNLFSF